tara:strand:- start:220 stop:348 length:129 start_codon:yes stop_codon:yes gene_type:complete
MVVSVKTASTNPNVAALNSPPVVGWLVGWLVGGGDGGGGGWL